MIDTFLATRSLGLFSLRGIAQSQRQLADAQTEISSGKHADLGVALGARITASVSFRQEQARLKSISDANTIVQARIAGSQSALDEIGKVAQDLMGKLLQATGGQVNPKALVDAAKAGIESIQSALNTTVDGVRVFSGINFDVDATISYFAQPPSAAQNSVASAFATKFGISQTDPNVSAISASSMQDFLDTSFNNLFDQPTWGASWSQASDQSVSSRISPTEVVQTSVTASSVAIRDLLKATVMLADTGLTGLNDSARQVTIGQATKLLSKSGAGVTELQATLGNASASIASANQGMDATTNLMNSLLSEHEDVDAAEVATRVASLSRDLEAAYTILARINKLSLLDKI